MAAIAAFFVKAAIGSLCVVGCLIVFLLLALILILALENDGIPDKSKERGRKDKGEGQDGGWGL